MAVGVADGGGVLEDAAYGAPGPGSLTRGGKDASFHEQPGDASQGRLLLQVPDEHLAHDRRLVPFHSQTRWVAWPFGIGAVAEGYPHPGQELPGAQLRQAPTAHPLSNECPLVLGHRSPYLQQECSKSWSLGSWLMGLSTNSTQQPRPCNSSRSSTWWTYLRASLSGAAIRTTSNSAIAAASRKASRPGRFRFAPL